MFFKIKLLFYKIFKLLPIKKNRVLLFSYYGANYGGSPKYLGEYFSNNADDLEIVWAFCNTDKYKNILCDKLVKYNSLKYFYYLATSHFIITNYRMTKDFEKRENQKYIQTWHSPLGLKAIEKDAEQNLPLHYVEMAKKDSKQIDLLLVGSKKCKEIFQRVFWYEGEYLDCGTPQCDMFFNGSSRKKEKVYSTYHISKDKKVLLYAPTFRENHDLSVYNIDYTRLLEALNKKYNNEWVVLLRLHPHLLNMVDKLEFNDCLINATSYDDIQELLCCADMVITDYSGIMFDYLITGKPCILYMSDYDNYIEKERKLNFDLSELPFPRSFNNDELDKVISCFDYNSYLKKCNYFLENIIVSFDDGGACARVYNYILSQL